MSNEYSNSTLTDQYKLTTSKTTFSKFEYDLYHDEDNVALPVVSIKRQALPNDEVRWRVYKDKNLFMTIEGNKLSKKERAFLGTIDGMNFLFSQFKAGVVNFQKLKSNLKTAKY